MRKIVLGLLAALWLSPVGAAGLNDMTEDERQSFRAEVRAYLLDNPEVLMEAIQVLEQRQQAQQAENDVNLVQNNARDIFDDGISYIGGNPDGDITLVEFQDYRCGYCRKAHSEVAELIESDGNIRLIVKEFPILGEQSTISSRLAVATLHKAGPDAYKRLGDFLITFNGNLTPRNIETILVKHDIPADEILAYMDDDAVTDHISTVRSLASRLQITGTPTFVLGDELLRGYVPLANMRELVDYTRATRE